MPKALSVYLDLLRFSAALVVFIFHANYDRFTGGLPILWRIAGLGNDAVMVFFVLSGFVIAYVSVSRERTASAYFAARLARLWSVGITAIILTIVLDNIGAKLSPAMYDGWWFVDSKPILRTLANLLFVNEIWFWSIRPFSNGPYWSIGYEFWYYVIFGATLFLKGIKRVACLCLLIIFIGPKILLLLPVWLAGVWAFRTKLAGAMSTRTAAYLFVFTVASYMALRLSGATDFLDETIRNAVGQSFASERLKWSRHFLSSYCIGILIAFNFVASRALFVRMPTLSIPCDGVITYLAGFTFSLYLFHYPLLQFFAAIADFFSITSYKPIMVISGTLAVVWLLGSWAERQKAPLKHLLLMLSAKSRAKLLSSRSDG